VLLVGLNLPTSAVFAAIAAVVKDFPTLKWTMLSVEAPDGLAREDALAQAPAMGMLNELKDLLRQAVVEEGGYPIFARPEAALEPTHSNGANGLWPYVRLTRGEARILQMLSKGLSNKEIAQQLRLSPYTVKNHVHHILDKLNVRNRIEAAMMIRGRSN